MGYIKFVVKFRQSDETGKSVRTVISRIESDMADESQLDTNLIFHALAARGGKVEASDNTFPFILDHSLLS